MVAAGSTYLLLFEPLGATATGGATPATDSKTIVLPASLTVATYLHSSLLLNEGWLPEGTTPQVTRDGVVIRSQTTVDNRWEGDNSAQGIWTFFLAEPGYEYKIWNGTVGTVVGTPDPIATLTTAMSLTDHLGNAYVPTGETTTVLESGDITQVVYKTGTMQAAIGGTFTPADLGDQVVCWLKADALSLSNNDPVSSWTDSSGNGHAAVQATASKRPLYKTNSLNGQPAVQFDGADDDLLVSGLATAMSDDDTYLDIWVLKPNSTNNFPMLSSYPLGSAAEWFLALPQGGDVWWGHQANNSVSYDASIGLAWQILSVTKQATEVGELHVNGAEVTSFTESGLGMQSTPTMSGDARMGGYFEPGWNLDGLIAERIVLNGVPRDGQRQMVEGYLAHKYGLTASLPSGHPYKLTAPLWQLPTFVEYHEWQYRFPDHVDVEFAARVVDSMDGIQTKNAGLTITPPSGWGLSLFLRDEGNRRPVTRTGDGIEWWPVGGVTPEAFNLTDFRNFQRMPNFHTGEFLDLRDTDGSFYAAALAHQAANSQEWAENNPNYIRLSNPEGIKLFVRYTAYDPALGAGYAQQLQDFPVPKLAASDAASSGAFGNIGTPDSLDVDLWASVIACFVDFADQVKSGNTGWCNYGIMPERMVEYATGQWRAHAKRPISTGHYPSEGLGYMCFLDDSQEIQDAFWLTAQYIRDFIQCDSATSDPNKTQWGFYHGYTSVPWHGVTHDGRQCSLIGHWIRPSTLLMASRYYHSYYFRQGFTGWINAVDLDEPEETTGRENHIMVIEGLHAKRFLQADWTAENEAKLVSLSEDLIATPLLNHSTGALFHPLWLEAVDEILGSAASEAYIVSTSAAILGNGDSAYGSVDENIGGTSAIAVHYHAGRFNIAIPLADHPTSDPVGAQLGPGPLGSRHLEQSLLVGEFYRLLYAATPVDVCGRVVKGLVYVAGAQDGHAYVGGMQTGNAYVAGAQKGLVV